MVAYTTDDITTLIVTVRGKRVILDRDLAALYGVPTFRFNEAVKRNRNRFPEDFMFQLTGDEAACLTSQIAMSKSRRGGRRTLPYAFTEHGTVMAANILRGFEVAICDPKPVTNCDQFQRPSRMLHQI